MTLRIKERFGLGGSVRVVDSVPGWRARRSRNFSLSVERADALLRNRPPSFEEGLGEVKEVSPGLSFEVEELGIPGVLLVRPRRFRDRRGYFAELYQSSEFARLGIPTPVQLNASFSFRGVVRGLHYQLPPREQGKLVLVPRGRILDVAMDVRRRSPTFGQYASAELDEENGMMLRIPPRFAHEFQALENSAVVYMVTNNEYAPECERCVNYGYVKWYLEVTAVSDKDERCPELARAEVFDRSAEAC